MKFREEIIKMISRKSTVLSIFAAAIIALCIPAMAQAQGGYGGWGQGGWGQRRGGNNDYFNRGVRDAIRRVESRSDDFEDHLDNSLDRSRYDDTRREDRINDMARQFRDAARRLRSSYGDGRNNSNSEGYARQLIQIGSRIDRIMGRNRFGGRAENDWAQIRQDLNVIANAFNVRGGRGGYGNGGYGNGGYGGGYGNGRPW